MIDLVVSPPSIPLPTLGRFLGAVVVSKVCIVSWWEFRTTKCYSVLLCSLSICYFSFINFFFLLLCQSFFCIQLSIWYLSWFCFELEVGPGDSLCCSAHWKTSFKLRSPPPALLKVILLWGNNRLFMSPYTGPVKRQNSPNLDFALHPGGILF